MGLYVINVYMRDIFLFKKRSIFLKYTGYEAMLSSKVSLGIFAGSPKGWVEGLIYVFWNMITLVGVLDFSSNSL